MSTTAQLPARERSLPHDSEATSTTATPIAIVGGGISGLSAAYELTCRGVPFVLYEAGERLGGLIRTEHVNGFTIEAGADSMLAQKRAGVDLCRELGLESRLLTMKRPRAAYVWDRGRLHRLPSPAVLGIPATWRALATYGLLPVPARARFALEPLLPPRRSGADESVGAFFRRRFGGTSVRLLARPLLGGIHAGDIERLSLHALFPRLAGAARQGSVLRWVQRTARGGDADGAFRSLAGGMGELVEAIRRRLPEAAVRCESPVLSLAAHDDGWQVTTPHERSTYRAVILACPAHVAARLLEPIDASAAALCRQVRYVSTASVALAWPRRAVAHHLAGSGFVVARSGPSAPRITAGTWVSSKWEGRAPPEHVLLRAYVGSADDPHAVDLDDGALIDVAVRELSAILSITGPPELARVSRWRDAGAQHETGHLGRIAELEQRLRARRGLLVTGSGFRSVGVPDCIADGRAVAASAESVRHED